MEWNHNVLCKVQLDLGTWLGVASITWLCITFHVQVVIPVSQELIGLVFMNSEPLSNKMDVFHHSLLQLPISIEFVSVNPELCSQSRDKSAIIPKNNSAVSQKCLFENEASLEY